MQKNVPRFLGVGSQRAGTTWLYKCLQEHPEIYLPEKKELHFFDLNYQQGVESYLQNFPKDKLSQFKTWGEITPNYYQHPKALERIKECNPQIKLIYIVRNPIERAYSHFKLFSDNHFKGKSFSEVINSNKNIIDLGLQAKHLVRMYELFSKKNILVLPYDELCEQPRAFLQSVFVFLGVDETFIPTNVNNRINRVVFPQTQKLFKSLKLHWLISLIKETSFADHLKDAANPKAIENITYKDKLILFEKFNEDVQQLEQLLDVNLQHWLNE